MIVGRSRSIQRNPCIHGDNMHIFYRKATVGNSSSAKAQTCCEAVVLTTTLPPPRNTYNTTNTLSSFFIPIFMFFLVLFSFNIHMVLCQKKKKTIWSTIYWDFLIKCLLLINLCTKFNSNHDQITSPMTDFCGKRWMD